MWDEPGTPGGWKRGIKYNNKEYEELLKRMGELRKRLGVRADHCEKVAWVLGKEGVDLDAAETEMESGNTVTEKEEDVKEGEVGEDVKKQTATAKPVPKASRKETKTPAKEKGAKRKAEEEKLAPEEVRRSGRRRTHAYYGED
jgi:hypothetical protein